MDAQCAAYAKRIMALPDVTEWVRGAKAEPAEMEELDAEF
jgi:glutathione S-transferase